MAKTKNIKYGSGIPTEEAAGKPAQKLASIPGVYYKGSGTRPEVNAVLEKLKKDGASSLDSSGIQGGINVKNLGKV